MATTDTDLYCECGHRLRNHVPDEFGDRSQGACASCDCAEFEGIAV